MLMATSLMLGCKNEDSPFSPTDQKELTVKVENDSLIYSLTIPKSVYSSGDSLNAVFTIEDKTNNYIKFPFDSNAIHYSVLNDSSRAIMRYPKSSMGRGFFALVKGKTWWTIVDQLYDDLNIPIRPGSYKLYARAEYPITPTLTISFTVK
jgi:hypothetical protein